MPNVNVNRQIYNVLGLFVSPSPSTGFMFSSGTSGVNLLRTIPRVQSASTSATPNREDVLQYGGLARIDQIITSPADVSLNFDYLLVDGYAESVMGFAAKGEQTFISGLIDNTQQEKNYFVAVAPEGSDLIGTTANANNINVIGISNGVISNYSLNLAVGTIPRVSVTVQGSNRATYTGSANKASPAIDFNTALPVAGPTFTIPAMNAYTGANIISALKPGDITVGFPRLNGFGDYMSGLGSIRVQSVGLSIPLSTDSINVLGNPFPVARPVTFPINTTLTIDATSADIAESSIANLFCSDDPVDLLVTCRVPNCQRTGSSAVTIRYNGAKVTSHDWSSAIGQSSTTRITFSNQVGGITNNYLAQGIVFSGNYIP